jgi:hypothetical protein
VKTGALDYILKPFKVSAILPVLSRALAVRRLRMENAELNRAKVFAKGGREGFLTDSGALGLRVFVCACGGKADETSTLSAYRRPLRR